MKWAFCLNRRLPEPIANFEVLEGSTIIGVGEGNASEGAFYEAPGTPGVPTGHDSIISPITPVNQMTHTFTQNYRAEENAHFPCHEHCPQGEIRVYRNVPTSLEGGPVVGLEDYLENNPLWPDTGPRSRSGTEWTPLVRNSPTYTTKEKRRSKASDGRTVQPAVHRHGGRPAEHRGDPLPCFNGYDSARGSGAASASRREPSRSGRDSGPLLRVRTR